MKKMKFCVILALLLCAIACMAACTDTPDTNSETTADSIADTTVEVTQPVTEKQTDAELESETEAETACHLLFEDNFDGTEIDATKWVVGTPEQQPSKNRDISLWDPSMVELDGNGNLLLRTEWDAEAKSVRCGTVATKGLFEAGYGYYEASIKFPMVYARTCSFAVITDNTRVNAVTSVCSVRRSVTYLQGSDGEEADILHSAYINLYDGRYHTIGVLWDETGYTFYIDGKETHKTDVANTETGYISLLWEAPLSDGAGRVEIDPPAFDRLTVDYVRVYSSLPDKLGKAVNPEAELLFNDDFDGDELDFSKWRRLPEWKRNELCYWSHDMTTVDGNGNMVIKIEWDAEKNSVKSGGIYTGYTFKFVYGYCEAKIKFPKTYGTWGAFWMMCGDVWKESAADGVEIDIVETINNETGAYNHALHSNYAALNSLGPDKLFTADIYDGEYHTFGVLRSENGYFFYVDHKLSAIVPYYEYTPCTAEGYMELTCEAADWVGAGTPEALEQLPSRILTDYVRAWNTMPDMDP